MSNLDNSRSRKVLPFQAGSRPQNAANASKPGAYELALRVARGEVAPGGSVEVEVFITGYGDLQGAKLVFFPPPYFVDAKHSKWRYDMGELPDGRAVFGTTEQSFIGDVGAILDLSSGGLIAPGWNFPSLFFDLTDNPTAAARIHPIVTEFRQERAPVEFTLKIHKKVPKGSHDLRFYLTYFNGQEWKTDSKSIAVSVPNWFKRNEGLTWTIGALSFIAAVAGVVVSVLN
jgi:hypothetical protein